MPIVTLQRQLREIGRIRIGQQVAAGNGRRRPSKLDTFRVTSKNRQVVEAAAELWGGTVTPWDNNGSHEFEVITTAAVLDIVVPPGQPVSQWFEMWTGGGCARRCDGKTNVLDMSPCACPQDPEERVALAAKGEACKPTTRLSVMLPGLPDLGVLRLESHGYYAAVELMGSAELLAMASAQGVLIPARLRLDQREKKVPGKPTNKYAVPVIEIATTLGQLGLPVLGDPAPGQIAAPATRQLAATNGKPPLPTVEPPASSDFRPPATPDGPRAAATGAAPTDTGAAAPTAPDPAPAGVAGESAEPELTRDRLGEIIAAERLDFEAARRLRLERWPDDTYQLTNEDRAWLLGELRDRREAIL